VISLEIGSFELFDAPVGNIRAKGSGNRRARAKHIPAFLLVQLVAHALAELLELAFRFGIVGVDHEILEVP